jgi:predicted nucleotidyltransferase
MLVPFEGWLLKDWDRNVVWLVKGYEHPTEGYVAIPYRKVYSGEPWNLRGLTRYLECVGREVQVVPRSPEISVVDPSEALKQATIPAPLRELLEQLDPEWAGLTGSRALGAAKPSSDFDILVYSSRPSELYKVLEDLAAESKIKECEANIRYSKVGDTWSSQEFRLLHSFKLLDSCYMGVPYTLRMLRYAEERECKSSYRSLGWSEGLIRLAESGEKFLVPATYTTTIVGVNAPVTLVTWRTRYQELPPGLYLARGLLQASGSDLYLVPDIRGYVKPLEVWARQRSHD